MSFQSFNGRLTSKTSGFQAVRAAIAAISLVVATTGSSWAQSAVQNEISALLPVRTTILTAPIASLDAAVATVLLSNTVPGLTPADIAIAALQSVPVKIVTRTGTTILQEARRDRNASGPSVAEAAINKLISTGTDVTLAVDVAAITDGMIEVNGTNPALNLAVAGKEGVVIDSLVAISNAASKLNSVYSEATLLSADTAIGNALATDPALEGLPLTSRDPDALLTILEVGITGVNGPRGTAQTVIPSAAAAFVEGIVSSGTIPDEANGITLNTFAVGILRPLARNTTTDELVANKIGAEFSSSNSLEGLASALFTSYPAAVAKVTQGLVDDVAAVDMTEASRASFVGAITTAATRDTVAITDGATYADPFFSSEFTSSVFASLLAASPATTARRPFPALPSAYAVGIAAGVGNILGQDANELTNVAGVYASLIDAGTLPAAGAPAYATTMLTAAVRSRVPVFAITALTPTGGGGGALGVSQALITAATQTDFQSIGDQFASAIVTSQGVNIGTRVGATTAAAQIGALALDLARFIANDTLGLNDSVAANLAGSIFEQVVDLDPFDSALLTQFQDGRTSTDAQTLIMNAIEHDVELATGRTIDPLVTAEFTAVGLNPAPYNSAPVYGAIAVQETAITNL